MIPPETAHESALAAVRSSVLWAFGVLASLGVGKALFPPVVEWIFNRRKARLAAAEDARAAARRADFEADQDEFRKDLRAEVRSLARRVEKVERAYVRIREIAIEIRVIAESDRLTIARAQATGQAIDLTTFMPLPTIPELESETAA